MWLVEGPGKCFCFEDLLETNQGGGQLNSWAVVLTFLFLLLNDQFQLGLMGNNCCGEFTHCWDVMI